jgi:hypothetical protein
LPGQTITTALGSEKYVLVLVPIPMLDFLKSLGYSYDQISDYLESTVLDGFRVDLDNMEGTFSQSPNLTEVAKQAKEWVETFDAESGSIRGVTAGD